MTAESRRQEIVHRLKHQGELEVNELADELDVSVETVRRDLRILSQRRVLKRVHGGAVLLDDIQFSRNDRHYSPDGIEEVTEKALTLFKPGDSLFLEGGPLGCLLARKLEAFPGITVVSNSIDVVDLIDNHAKGNEAILLGGRYNAKHREATGQWALDQLNDLVLDYAVTVPDALDQNKGMMKYRIPQASIVSMMVKQANKTIALTSPSVFGRTAMAKYCDLSDLYCVVSEANLEDEWVQCLAKEKVTLLI